MQRVHLKRILEWPPKLRMRLQVGVACGEVIEVEGDTYGDAVNVASRLSDLSGADQIWATDTGEAQFTEPPDGVRFRSLGPINIRGKAETRVVFRVEWQEEVHTGLLTAPGDLAQLTRPKGRAGGADRAELAGPEAQRQLQVNCRSIWAVRPKPSSWSTTSACRGFTAASSGVAALS
jgi:adenylate cyclase